MKNLLVLLALSVGVTASPATAIAGTPVAQDPEDDPVERPIPPETPAVTSTALLREWYGHFDRNDGRYWRDAREEYVRLLGQVEHEAQKSEEGMKEAGAVLLDLASWGLDRLPRVADYSGGLDRQRTRRDAYRILTTLLDGDLGPYLLDWMADEVLVLGSQHSPRRRYLALHFVDKRRTDTGRMALLSIGRNRTDPLRPDVLWILATWPDEAVDLFLVGLVGRKFEVREHPHPFTVLLKRVRDNDEPLGPRATGALQGRLGHMLLSTDWRQASRAIELARGFEPERAVPLLLDALSAWHRRGEMGGGSKRILNDIVRELRQISGRSIGTNPRNWITWWIAVREGKTTVAAEMDQSAAPRTTATFFGLRPVTDRVTFVIDKSGSMETEWGTEDHNRYVEAIEQMMRFLQASGEETRFNVILFDGTPLRSTPHLVQATPDALRRARRSLLKRGPGGGTNLRPAVELALRLDANGDVDPERLEADTIIVLCDGETAEGRSWVKPMIDNVYNQTRIMFHCVLIGVRGDGTLEELAQRTGGDFIRIGG